MKRTLIVACTLLSALATLAQGTVYLANHGPNFRAPVYGPELADFGLSKWGNTAAGLPPGTQVYSGLLLSGSGWTAQLFAANGANQPESLLMPTYVKTTFRTGAAAGFFNSTTVTLWNVPKDAPVATVQLRVWDNSSGLYPTWDDAVIGFENREICLGKSLTFNVANIGGDVNSSPYLFGLQSFNVYHVIPEPAVTALLLTGTALGCFYRRKLGSR